MRLLLKWGVIIGLTAGLSACFLPGPHHGGSPSSHHDAGHHDHDSDHHDRHDDHHHDDDGHGPL